MQDYELAILTLVCYLFRLSHGLAEAANGVNHVVTAKDRLVRDLTSNQPTAMPFTLNQSVELWISFYPMKILRLDARAEVLELDTSFTVGWEDVRLTWNSSYYDDLEKISLPASDIWTPKFGFTSSVGTVYDPDWQSIFEVKVMDSGSVYWTIYSILSISCDLDMRLFPFDTQQCDIEISPMIHTLDIMDLVIPEWGGINTNFLAPNKEYDLVDAKENRLTYEPYDGDVYSMLTFTLRLRRKPAFYVMTLLVPSMLLSLLTILVFMVPADAGEKISLAISILLSFSVFLIVLSDNIPQVSDKAPILGLYLTVIICLTGVALLCTVLVLSFYHTQPVRPIPSWIHKIVIIGLGTLTGMKRNAMQLQQQQWQQQQQDSPQREQEQQQKDRQAKDEYLGEGIKRDENSGENQISDEHSIIKIARDVHQILTRMQDEEKDEQMRKMWQLASRILDRFFLIIYLVIMLGTAIWIVEYYSTRAR